MRIARPEKGSAVCSVVSHAGPCYLADAVLTALETAGVAPRAKDPRASLGMQLRRLARLGRVRNVGRNRWERIKE